MKKNTLIVFIVAILLLIGGALIYVSYLAEETSEPPTDTAPTEKIDSSKSNEDVKSSTVDAEPKEGRYIDYSLENVSAKGYDKTIIFFHAPWCVECRGFEKAIESSDIPRGVQILKTDYDTSTDLRKEYGVTIQSTFVKVDSEGNKQSLWNGYGRDKSVDAILENT